MSNGAGLGWTCRPESNANAPVDPRRIRWRESQARVRHQETVEANYVRHAPLCGVRREFTSVDLLNQMGAEKIRRAQILIDG